MFSHYFQSFEAAPWIGSTMLLLAMAVFAAIVIRVLRMKKDDIERMERLPLEGAAEEKNP